MTAEADIAIRVRDLAKRYRVWNEARPTNLGERLRVSMGAVRQRRPIRRDVWGLRGVSFDVRRGHVLGVLGPNGAGKSTLLQILARITEPTEGYAELRGRVSSLLEVGTGFHPELSGRDNVYLNGAILGMSRAETAARFDEIVEFSGVGDFIDLPTKRYSSGMQVRLAFAVAAHLDPEVILLDEVLAVGDKAFQQKSLRRIGDITETGRTVLFVSHDVSAMSKLCDTALVLETGRVAFYGPVEDAIDRYLHSEGLGGEAGSDRAGTGEVRVTGVHVADAAGGREVQPDKSLEITVELATEHPEMAAGTRLEVVIGTTASGPLVSLQTELDAEAFEAGSLVCVVDGLPLRPGRYHLSTTLLRRSELVDHSPDEGELEVLAADDQPRAAAPPAGATAPVVVAHRWRVEEPRRVPVRSALVPGDEVK